MNQGPHVSSRARSPAITVVTVGERARAMQASIEASWEKIITGRRPKASVQAAMVGFATRLSTPESDWISACFFFQCRGG